MVAIAEGARTDSFSSGPRSDSRAQGCKAIQQSTRQPEAAGRHDVASSSDAEDVSVSHSTLAYPQNKNCHFCEHSPKRSAMLACSAPSCGQVRPSCGLFGPCESGVSRRGASRVTSLAPTDKLTSKATTQMFCEKCLARHLGQPNGFSSQADADAAKWKCPLCMRSVCVPLL